MHLHGLTLPEAQNRRIHVAQKLQLPLRAVRVEAHPSGRADLCHVAITRKDPFSIDIPWDGPYNPGACISEPIVCGVYEDSKVATFTVVHKHFLVMGMTDVGKSKLWQTIYGEILNRRNVAVIYADAAKGEQTVGPLREGLAHVILSEGGIHNLVSKLNGLIRERTDILANEGLDKWHPRSSLEYLIVHVEEVGGIAGRTFVKLAERARSAGISLILSLQRASSDRMNTSVRYNLGTSMCFGTKDVVDSQFALGKATIQAGACPHEWGSRKKGQFYLEDDSIDTYRFPIPIKSLWLGEGYRTKLASVVSSGEQYRSQPSRSTKAFVESLSIRQTQEVSKDRTMHMLPSTGNNLGTTDQRISMVSDRQSISTEDARMRVAEWVTNQGMGMQFSFSQAKEALCTPQATDRGQAWLNVELKRLLSASSTPRVERLGSGIYRVISC